MTTVHCRINAQDKVTAEYRHPNPATTSIQDDDPRYLEFIGVTEDFEDARAAQHDAINTGFEVAMLSIKTGYPDSEILTWDHQEKEAKAWQADNNKPAPMLNAIASRRGMQLSDLVSHVITKSDAYELAAGSLVGKRQVLRDQLDALTEGVDTVADIKAITWDSIPDQV